ncbi:uncharacterized protein LOC108733270 [Agrilus planipennis]|uniref:Uncharacterized protein LOC108733270 n=1 Tax=Agrilus planipennis TaxID=224129 RepID=A0A7F5RJK6_AGRPL|nr:uncharacterized protein LOC108733270 [Agrilus planipennis]
MCINASGWKYKIFHLPWLICCFTICTFDAVAVVIYGKHVTETKTLEEWFRFIGADENPDDSISDYIDTTNFSTSYLIIPSIAMAVIFSRLVIIWFINVIFFLCLICSVCGSHPDRKGRIHAPPPVRYSIPVSNDTVRIPPSYTMEEAELKEEKVHQRVNPNNKLPNDSSKKLPPAVTEDSNSNEARIKRWQLYYGSDAFDLRVKQPRSSNTDAPSVAQNERSRHGEDGLRSQLPWSYFQNRSDTGRPRSATPEVMPPIPVPDYPMRFEGYNERKRL